MHRFFSISILYAYGGSIGSSIYGGSQLGIYMAGALVFTDVRP